MRYGPGHKEEARARIVEAAGRGFRRQGFGGIGVDGLAKEASVTSGAFYGHFKSKDAAFEAVIEVGIRKLRDSILAHRAEHGAAWLAVYARLYMTDRRTCDLAESCALQSLTPDVQRASPEIRDAFAAEVREVVRAVADGLEGTEPADRERRAWAILAMLSGGVTVARGMSDPAAGEAIAEGVMAAVSKLAG
jgi:TetR/AcrR family transcriptional repressor of nem operon